MPTLTGSAPTSGAILPVHASAPIPDLQPPAGALRP